jgi:hypothetical protein
MHQARLFVVAIGTIVLLWVLVSTRRVCCRLLARCQRPAIS